MPFCSSGKLGSDGPGSTHSMFQVSETRGPFEELKVESGQRKMKSADKEVTRSRSCPMYMTSSYI